MNFSFIKPRSEIPIGEVKSFTITSAKLIWRLEKDGYIGLNTLLFNTSGSTITVTVNKDKSNTISIPTANTPVNILGLIEEIQVSGATSGVSIVTEALKISEMQKEGVIRS